VFLAYPLTNWEGVLPRALAPFGRVTAFEWRSLGFDDRRPDWLAQRDGMQAAMLDAFSRANAEQRIDAVVAYVSGRDAAPETLTALGRAGAVVFNMCWDDKLGFPGRMLGGRHEGTAAIAHAVDLNLTNAPESIVKYAVHGGLALFWPEAAHPEVHRPFDVPFDIDVSFAGACYGRRPRCHGRGWPNGAVTDDQMIELYSRSRINLGFGGVGHSRRLMCLKGRDFEVPMSGGLYLTQDNPELGLVYDVGREIVTYTDADFELAGVLRS
jgi:hypothetical protein